MSKKGRLEVGDMVTIVDKGIRKHLQIAGLGTIGKLVRIDPENKVGNHVRPYILVFAGIPGEWSYTKKEIKHA